MSQNSELAQSILAQLQDGKDVYTVFTRHFENEFLLNGKTLSAWRQHFKIQIPQSCNLAELRQVATKLYNVYQEASFFYAEAQAQLSAIQTGGEKLFREAHHKHYSAYKNAGAKLPAADTLKREAEYDIGDIKDAESQAGITKNFWKEIVEGLNNQRRLVEQISISLSVERRFDGGPDTVPTTPNRGSYNGRSENNS